MRRIGDISIQDAELLARYARSSKRILEFGVGASTQILALHSPADSHIVSVDTDQNWINKTKHNFGLLGIRRDVHYLLYPNWVASPLVNVMFDLVFDDGYTPKRFEFALAAWPRIAIGGVLMFHDTRTSEPVSFVSKILDKHFNEIESIQINETDSNITVIKKKSLQHYVNWNHVEKRQPWEWGGAEPPPKLWEK